MPKLNQSGFHVVETGIILFVLIVVGFVGYRLAKSAQSSDSSQSQSSETTDSAANQSVVWQFGANGTWETVGNVLPPDCPGAIVLEPPVDLNKVESVLYPGQVRGTHFKAHGGFGSKNNTNQLEVRAPIDGVLSGGVRYIESELQYKFEFTHPCGLMFMFDHLQELSPEMQAIADTMPEAKPNDTRTSWRPPRKQFKQGDLIAVAVGIHGNAGFDFGVYDLRQPNKASKKSDFQAKYGHEAAYNYFALCWLDMFSPANNAIIDGLPARDGRMGKTSEYCS